MELEERMAQSSATITINYSLDFKNVLEVSIPESIAQLPASEKQHIVQQLAHFLSFND